MSRIFFHTGQMAKQKQYTALLREVKCFCLARAVARPPPNRLKRSRGCRRSVGQIHS
jgi:hypothetical protein